MYHFKRDGLYNLAGIERFFFTDSAFIIKDPRPRFGMSGNSLIVSEISLLPSGFWYEGLVSRNTVSVRIGKENRRPGESYSVRLSGIISRNSPIQQEILNSFSGRRFSLIAKDRNGFLRFLGGREYGLDFSYESDSGTNPSERNGTEFSFRGEMPEAPPYVHGNLYDSLSEAAPPDFGDVSISERVLSDGFTIRVLAL